MSKLQIPTVCEQCQKHFFSKKRGSRFCSDICRAQYARDNHSKLFKSQSKVIKIQAKVITEQNKELASSGRNCYFGLINNRMVKIKSPLGTDIAKLLDIRKGTENILKQISLLPEPERNSYEIKYQ
jgi:hypothetical protein